MHACFFAPSRLPPSRCHCSRSRGIRSSTTLCALRAETLALATFSFIVDDLVFWDGSTLMAQPGGGGPQTLFGYQLYEGQRATVGLAAGVGSDLPPPCRDWLAKCGARLDGLLQVDAQPTPRAWQVCEEDGRRAEIWRTSPERRAGMLRPPLSELPPAFRAARAYHVAVSPEQPGWEHLQELRLAAASGLLSVETFMPASLPLPPAELQQLASLCDIFSPNEAEARSMLQRPPGPVPGPGPGPGPGLHSSSASRDRALLELAGPFLEAGASVVAVRRGPEGAMVQSLEQGAWEVPAVPGTRVVDTTGCGNAFCGAVLAAVAAGEPLQVAGAWGAVAGSLMAEHPGVPRLTPGELRGEAVRRLELLLPLVRRLGVS